MVMGRSVFRRNVRQGALSTVDTSWIPPESVNTNFAPLRRERKSMCLPPAARQAVVLPEELLVCYLRKISRGAQSI